MTLKLNKHAISGFVKKILHPNGESYKFRNKKLYFKVGSRPIRRKYILSGSDVVRNDVLQIDFFERTFGPDDVLWDLGSHHGHYSIFAASVVRGNNQVFSFEPDKVAREVQFKNIGLNNFNDKIKLFDIAVSNIDGQLKFASDGGKANSHVVKTTPPANHEIVISVRSKTLNTLFNELPHPSFVKIDTEGAEIDILKQASELLSRPEIQFICELHPFAWKSMNVKFDELQTILTTFGREITLLDPKKNPKDLPYYGTILF